MFSIAFKTAGGLDFIRARVLEQSMRFEGLRSVFRTRWKRLLATCLIAYVIQLALALRFPIQVLVLGPVFLGAPHLLASLRHGISSSPQSIFSNLGNRMVLSSVLWLGVIFTHLLPLSITGYWAEITGMILLAWIWNLRSLGFAVGILALGAATHYFPLGTGAFMVLFHHFVAFFHWIRSAKAESEKRVAWISFLIFTALHALIFAGLLDSYLGDSEWPGIQTRWIESTFYGWTSSPIWIIRFIVAYAFGQSIHYTLWLKVIPEQQHIAQVPTSFRQSLRLFLEDFGKNGSLVSVIFLVAVFGLAVFCRSAEFRTLYFSIASIHGFYEIFALFPREAHGV